MAKKSRKESRILISKYNNVCKKCKEMIVAGVDYISKDPEFGWVHAKCCHGGDVWKNRTEYKADGSNEVVTAQALEYAISTVPDEIQFDDKPKKKFIPSKYQQAIFDWIVNGKGHGVVEAVAGSGKTTTIVEALSLTPNDANVAFLAFNKHIADELQRRAPSHVHVSTIHSLGLAEIRRHFGYVRVDQDKLSGSFDELWPIRRGQVTKEERAVNRAKRSVARKIISLSKAILLDMNDKEAVDEAMDRYGIEIDSDLQDVIDYIPQIIAESRANVNVVDFDDMVWFPASMNEMSLTKYDYLFVDETQDLNASQVKFLLKSIKPDGRIIAVGDRWQSLYGFRGADTEAIPQMIRTLNATVLPLSITYRNPVKHVELAKHYVPEIEARPNAPEGTIEIVENKKFVGMVDEGDMILCRTNAPLINPAFQVIRSGKKACVRGRDIGASLIAVIDRFDTESLDQFSIRLDEYFRREFEKLIDHGKELQAEMLQDRIETIVMVMSECTSNDVSELRSKFKMLFSDDRMSVTFSSIHRAKGLEGDRVFILRPDLMPHPKATKEWEHQQEQNCMYVAFTRSKQSLVFVKKENDDSDDWGF